ncbi:chemotaxis protein CheZ [Desulfatibacillum alkenivorans DSM 16219]|jgi:chemotaxis protein CheZ|uniref:Protein phosphatase CheZ n=1 Tax=Desulfatibacillum alkenivorans DSM 16219 TaxID=1121393 RepID=A0A1M6CBD6_9BACT|nr:protein phosphatase CheZ [Desulfatibacillum alkenivorans]SHI58319.1 chemotaxis protein CheZ [Desulfatibacillum alkenivorans DSM 16219]
MQLDNETLQDIVITVKDVQKVFQAPAPDPEGIDKSKAQVGELLTTLEMLMAEELMEICDSLLVYMDDKLGGGPVQEACATLSFALDALLESLDRALNGDHGDYGMAEVMAILSGQTPLPAQEPEAAAEDAAADIIAEALGEDSGDGLPDVLDMLEDSLAPVEASGQASAGDFQTPPLPQKASPAPKETQPKIMPPIVEMWRMDTEDFMDAFQKHLEVEGGSVSINQDANGEPTVTLSIPRDKIGGIQAAFTGTLASGMTKEAGMDPAMDGTEIITKMLEFMKALSAGNIDEAETILESVTKGSPGFGLFGEIGQMARALHDSLREFSNTLDPEMKGLVEEKLPDSSLRLEHIIELTENAASTTMDLTEVIQERNEKSMALMDKLKSSSSDVEVLMASLDKLMDLATENKDQPSAENIPIMHGLLRMAREKVQACGAATDSIMESTTATNKDLVDIFTAQDYQDLTGQVIQKIITLIKDLESKLLNLVTKFGVKVTKDKTGEQQEELYGPSHAQRDDAVHSQDEVDALLKEFGF